MGSKGRRRREKNYLASHGGDNRLPPPPEPGAVDAVPSKLRRLMQLMNRSPPKSGASKDLKDGGSSRDKDKKLGERKERRPNKDKESSGEVLDASGHDKKNKKRKRKAVTDLRFQALDPSGGLIRKQKRKGYLEARKKKHKKEKESEVSEFPKYEQIRFGEVVEAPPKLSFPKASNNVHDAFLERRRLKAVEAYRNHKAWDSRPGIRLPSIADNLSR